MTPDAFLSSLAQDAPPPLAPALQALWREGKGDWDGAHRCVTDADDPAAMWVHAFLHRKEGDAANAAYWYRRAGQALATGPHDAEWRTIAEALLAAS